LDMFSRRRRKNPRRRSGSSASGSAADTPLSVMKSSRQSRAIAVGHDIRVEIRAVPAAEPPASELIEAMVAETSSHYGARIDREGMPSGDPAVFAEPGGVFLVIYEDGRAVAGGGVKALADGSAEIKRMYVVPDARGRGVARRLLRALEDAAQALGYARVRLDTGKEQPHARALYESAGYREIPDYNDNPFATYWGEKDL
jgi:GNAT superfamily N-acetyltransferase